ncbi:MAG: protein kinase domain-containing protein [Polyangiaceae bacterium]
MTQKNVPVPTAPEPADSGDSTTNAKSNPPPAAAPPAPAEPRGVVPPRPPRGILLRPGTPTAFTPIVSPIPQALMGKEDEESAWDTGRAEGEEDDAPTMGPTPMIDLEAETGDRPAAPTSYRGPPAPPPFFGRAPGAFPPSNLAPAPQVPPTPSQQPPSGGSQALAVPQPSGVERAGGRIEASQSIAIRTEAPRALRSAAFHVVRSRAYSFVLDQRGLPIELGSGRFAKAFLGEERWVESKTDFRREVVIKILQKGVSDEDHLRFQMEKELLERVQGHPSIVTLYASGENEDPEFVPAPIRDQVESEFVILERMEMSLEERLKGSRGKAKKEDLLALDMRERVFRVLDYIIPVASAVEYAHLVRNVCHRDIKPANILIRLPDVNLRGSILEVRLADFNVAKLHDAEIDFGVTKVNASSVPGTQFFQSPEQETNVIELLVNTQQGSPEVEFFEDFYIHIAKNDTFSLFNRSDSYPVLYADRAKKRLVLGRPYREPSEINVRAKVQKSVARPADIYSLGALFYYLITGAFGNPKTLYDAFHKVIEYERADETNTIEAYLEHEYTVIRQLAAPKAAEGESVEVAPADRFFSYKHYLDGNGELIDPFVMKIIARCMIRNKPDSYCQAHEVETRGISNLVSDLIDLYSIYGMATAARPANLARRGQGMGALTRPFHQSRLRLWWMAMTTLFRRR